MNYYPFHIGDYIAHTAHLDPIEDCAYRRLLDAYYLNEGPLPADVAMCARQIRMKANLAEVEQVLKEFFELTEQGWRHARCDAEIKAFTNKRELAQANGKRGGRPKKQNQEKTESVSRGFSDQNQTETQAEPAEKLTKNQEPITNNQITPQPPLQGDSRVEVEEVIDLAPEDRMPTPQGAVCMAMKAIGVPDVNPNHSGLHALLNSGVPLETFAATARDCVARGKGSFRYILGVVERQEREARDLAMALQQQKVAVNNHKYAAAAAAIYEGVLDD